MSAIEVIDEVGGGRFEFPSGWTAGRLVTQIVEAEDHPRADLRGNPLDYRVVGVDGRVHDPDEVVAGPQVRLVEPEAAEVRRRRDGWLADIEAHGGSGTSISSATHLVLVERTGSRLADVERLRERLDARRAELRPPVPEATDRRPLPTAWLAGVGAVAMVGLAGAGLWWFLGRDDGTDTTAAAVDGELVTLPAEIGGNLGPGSRDEFSFEGEEGQNITILMLAPQNTGFGSFVDPQIELLDADGDQLAYNDDRQDLFGAGGAGNPLNSRIDITLPGTGTYTVVASDLSGQNAGSYTLVIEEGGPGGTGGLGGGFAEPAIEQPAVDPVTTIPFDAPVDAAGNFLPDPSGYGCGWGDELEGGAVPLSVEVDLACELVPVVFEVDEPGSVVVRATSSGHDPILWVLDDDRVTIAHNDDADGLDSRIELDLEPGAYEAVVGNLTGEPATIALTVDTD